MPCCSCARQRKSFRVAGKCFRVQYRKSDTLLCRYAPQKLFQGSVPSRSGLRAPRGQKLSVLSNHNQDISSLSSSGYPPCLCLIGRSVPHPITARSQAKGHDMSIGDDIQTETEQSPPSITPNIGGKHLYQVRIVRSEDLGAIGS